MSIEPRIEKITKVSIEKLDIIKQFASGEDSIDNYLKEEALEDSKIGFVKTFLIFLNDELAGYFSLIVDRVTVIKSSKLRANEDRRDMFRKAGTTNIPAIQIHHFGVDQKFQKQGNGRKFMDTILVVIKTFVLSYVGATLITVHSLNSVVGFYEKIGFQKTGDQGKDTANTSMAIHTDALYR